MAGDLPGPWVKGAVAVMALGVPLAFGGAGAYISAVRDGIAASDAAFARRLNVVEGLVGGHAISLAGALEYNDAHEKDAAREIARIDRCESRLADLSTNASVRPDPWTGTHGRKSRDLISANERRIDQLEKLPDRVEWLKTKVDELGADFSESRRYYQDTVIPMIQQSNQLQMQRIQQGME